MTHSNDSIHSWVGIFPFKIVHNISLCLPVECVFLSKFSLESQDSTDLSLVVMLVSL